ncbi:MAG: DUF2799 domain-containing protein [Alphaproteobacteria bacterium]|nr:DUF2799 domain-containing protein [Alphaproteobacteria bacterium]
MRSILVSSLLLALALSGCAGSSMGKAECQTADWKAVGYEDGAKGYGADRFGKRRKACAEHGVAANFDAYRAGQAEGIVVYCQPRNGYQLGTRGYRYAIDCPTHLAGTFQTANNDGFGLYERRVARDNIGKQLRYNQQRTKQIEHLIARKTAKLVSPRVRPDHRMSLVVELKQLGEEKVQVEQSISQLENDYADASRVYEGYRNSVANRY